MSNSITTKTLILLIMLITIVIIMIMMTILIQIITMIIDTQLIIILISTSSSRCRPQTPGLACERVTYDTTNNTHMITTTILTPFNLIVI